MGAIATAVVVVDAQVHTTVTGVLLVVAVTSDKLTSLYIKEIASRWMSMQTYLNQATIINKLTITDITTWYYLPLEDTSRKPAIWAFLNLQGLNSYPLCRQSRQMAP